MFAGRSEFVPAVFSRVAYLRQTTTTKSHFHTKDTKDGKEGSCGVGYGHWMAKHVGSDPDAASICDRGHAFGDHRGREALFGRTIGRSGFSPRLQLLSPAHLLRGRSRVDRNGWIITTSFCTNDDYPVPTSIRVCCRPL